MIQPLEGIRVVEQGHGIAAAYAGRLLADLGAEVLKIETRPQPTARRAAATAHGGGAGGETDGDLRGEALVATGLRHYLDAGKKIVALHPDQPAGLQALLDLLVAADVLVIGGGAEPLAQWRLDLSDLSERFPALVVVTASPLGWDHAKAGTPATDLEANALAAVAWAIGEPGREPLGLPYGLAEYATGTHAAAAALTALFERRRSGRGQHVDVATAEILASFTLVNSAIYVPHGIPWAREGRRASRSGGPYPYAIFPCADGHVCIIARSARDWQNLLRALGDPPWAKDPRYQDQIAMGRDYPDEVDALLTPLLQRHSQRELLALAREYGFPLAPVNRIEAVLAEPHYHARGFWRTGEVDGRRVLFPGLPYRFTHRRPASDGEDATSIGGPQSGPSGAANRPPAGARPDDAAGGPLAGLRVLDLAWVWSGPMVSQVLADLGAEVIKVEHGQRLDNSRLRGRPQRDGQPVEGKSIEIVPYFHALNHGKKSVTINMKDPRGAALIRRLAAYVDVVVENLTPGVLERLGVGYQALAEVNPRLIYLSMSAAGQTGPLRDMRAYAPVMSSMAGLESLIGYPGEPPVGMMTMGFADPNAGGHGVVAVLAALSYRERTGRGLYIDLSQIEALLAILPEPLLEHQLTGCSPQPRGNRHPGMAPRGIYPARGVDRWVALTVTDDDAWRRLAQLIVSTVKQQRDPEPDPSWALDPALTRLEERRRRQDELDRRLAAWSRSFDRDGLVALLRSHRIAAAPVLSIEEVRQHPYFRTRGLLQQVDHPISGGEELQRVPWHFSRTPGCIAGPAPLLGQHNDYVLRQLLRLDEDEILELTADGVIA